MRRRIVGGTGKFTGGPQLSEQVAHGGGFYRTREDGPFAGVRRKLIQQSALASAADNVNDVNPVGGEFLKVAEHLAIFSRQTFVATTDQFTFRPWNALPGFAAMLLDGFGHVRRIQKNRIIKIEDRPAFLGV